MKINETQLNQVNRQIRRILDSGNYYSKVYQKAGITGVSSRRNSKKFLH